MARRTHIEVMRKTAIAIILAIAIASSANAGRQRRYVADVRGHTGTVRASTHEIYGVWYSRAKAESFCASKVNAAWRCEVMELTPVAERTR